jgi:hypothetical protein
MKFALIAFLTASAAIVISRAIDNDSTIHVLNIMVGGEE